MKKIVFLPVILLALCAVSCKDTKEYDTYTAGLSRQIEAFDTLTSLKELALRFDSVQIISHTFDQKGIKLDEKQTAHIEELHIRLQKAFADAYERLASTPVTLPDDIPVPE